MDELKEECGVFGIFGHPEAANLTYLGLYALQHRGQESAGIAAADGHVVTVARGMGYVADIFDDRTLSGLTGRSAIGHTRYSTAGESRLSNAQPFLIDCVHGQMSICHNGNLVNAGEIRRDLVSKGSIFQTSSDTEVVLHLYARSTASSQEQAAIESLAQVRGAYSILMMSADRLIAARDPHGFRPMALGRLGDAWIVCSETCALDLIQATYVRDVEPGEVVVITAAGPHVAQAVPAGTHIPLRLRARLLRPSGQLRVRPQRERGADRDGPATRRGVDGRGRRRRAHSRLGRLRGDRLLRDVGHPDADGAHPQPLRRAARSSSRSSRSATSACA